ncbi:7-carboxy-7-deazaguanine synthase QueE [Novosphingobium sp. TH158]|uniref:7-carboxy-7-deazaguanine synthase QueE n=1 Tax=Novosphingobium sp. TH158 TaxID=2067455 RepID=UPI000C7AC0F5|nr:7-carboxy-7-deazaguanine synthase QueE [Novosphingobium sp. TH158]PLK26496.1 pyrroloquinoline quinone biosynthesis protein PqqE [Novosphingobium sp. TH158]
MALVLATTTPGEPEIFASVQGEGASAGRACAFVRLSRCNLACEWCDTAYTWRFSGDNRPHRDGMDFERSANQLTLDEADVAARIAALGRLRLVVTGGEPLLQAPALARLLPLLPGIHVEVETNGTVAPPPALDGLVHQWNVSPKLSHSGNPRDPALRPEALRAFAADPRATFKFVIAEEADIAEVRALADAHGIPGQRIWLMPEGRDSETIRARGRWLADYCSKHELNFSDRLHIHLFGDTRGT